jgi:hypothetical protein
MGDIAWIDRPLQVVEAWERSLRAAHPVQN